MEYVYRFLGFRTPDYYSLDRPHPSSLITPPITEQTEQTEQIKQSDTSNLNQSKSVEQTKIEK